MAENNNDAVLSGKIALGLDITESQKNIKNDLAQILKNIEQDKTLKYKLSLDTTSIKKTTRDVTNQINKIFSEIDSNKFGNGSVFEVKFKGLKGFDNYVKALKNLTDAKAAYSENGSSQGNIKKIIDSYAELQKAIKTCNIQLTNTNAVNSANNNFASLRKSLGRYLDEVKHVPEELEPSYKRLQQIFSDLSSDPLKLGKNGTELSREVKTLMGEINSQAGEPLEKLGDTVWNSLSDKLVKGLALSISAFAAKSLHDITENVIELDKALTELKKTTDETNSTYNAFLDDAAKIASKLGTTMSDVVNSVADVSRLGYNLTEAKDISKAILLYKNVADGVDNVGKASDIIVASMKAFGIEANNVMEIVDSFNEVGNRTAISAEDIGVIMQKAGASLKFAGSDIHEAVALAVGSNQIIRNADTAGTALKTMALRVQGATADLEEAGLATDGMAKSVSDLRNKILYLTDNKVDIQLDSKNFKSVYQILKEISIVWDDMDSQIDKSALLELLAGKRSANIVAGIIENFDDVEAALAISQNSAGSALKENETYLNSIEGKTAKLTSSFENLSRIFLNSGILKLGIDASNLFIKGLSLLDAYPAKIVVVLALITAVEKALKSIKIEEGVTVYSKIFEKWFGKSGFISSLIDVFKSVKVSWIQGANIFTNLGTSISMIWATAAGKVFLVVTALTALIGAIKLVSSVLPSSENYGKKFEKLKGQIDKIKGDLESLNSEFETAQFRIKELQGKETLTLVEQAELDNLRLQNELLAQQIELQKEKLKETQKEAAETARKGFNSYINEERYGWQGFDKFNAAISHSNIEGNKEYLRDFKSTLLEYEQELLNAGVDMTDDTLTTILAYVDVIDQALDPAKWLSDKWEDVLSNEKFKSATEALEKLGETGDVTADSLKSQKYEDFINYLIKIGVLADNSEISLQQLANQFNEGAISVGDYVNNLSPLSDELERATSAAESFKEATKSDYDDAFKGYAEAYSAFMEEYNSGRVGSSTYKAAAEMLLGSDNLEKLNYDFEAVYQQVSKLSFAFEDGESAAAGFLIKMSELNKNDIGGLSEGFKFNLYEDGSFDYSATEDDVKRLAEYFGTTEEAITSCLQALKIWGANGLYDINAVAEEVDNLPKYFKNAEDELVLSTEQVRSMLQEDGFDNWDIPGIISELEEMGYVFEDLGDPAELVKNTLAEIADTEIDPDMPISEKVDIIKEKVDELKDTFTFVNDYGVVNPDAFLKWATDLGLSSEEALSLVEYLKQTGEINIGENQFDYIVNSLNNAKEKADELNGSSTTDATQQITELGNQADITAEKVKKIKDYLDSIPGTYTATVNIKTNQSEQPRNSIYSRGFAKGTGSAASGRALTGELGPELIIGKDGSSYLAGITGMPEIVNMKGGETVYTAEETAKIFRGKTAPKFNTYAGGTGNIGKYLSSSASSKVKSAAEAVSKAAESVSNASKEAAKSAMEAAKDAANAYQELLTSEKAAIVDEIEKRIDAYQKEADALKETAKAAKDAADAKKDLLKDRGDIIKEAIDKQIEKLKDDADNYNNTINIQIDALEKELSALKDKNEEEEKALELQKAKDAYEKAQNTKNARVYTADKGWVWTADPEKLASAREEYEKLLADYEKEQAEKSIEDQINALKNQIEEMKKSTDSQVDELEKVSKSWDEELDKLNYTTEDYKAYMNLLEEYTKKTTDELRTALSSFGDDVKQAMELNSQYDAAQKAYESFEKVSDKEIERLKELKEQYAQAAENIKKTLEDYEYTLELAAKYSSMSFEQMANAVSEYTDKVKEAMSLNSKYEHNKNTYDSYATGTTNVKKSGLAITCENGNEIFVRKPAFGNLTYLDSGDGVIPANITARLLALGANPNTYLANALRSGNISVGSASTSKTSVTNNYFGDVKIDEVQDLDSFISQVKQEVSARQNR